VRTLNFVLGWQTLPYYEELCPDELSCRFIATHIMSEAHIETLTKTFQASGLDWALAEDSAKAVLRVAADSSINGE
jgi:hypothetical protein